MLSSWSFRNKVSAVLLLLWVASILGLFLASDDVSEFFGNVSGVLTATGLTYAVIDEDTKGYPLNWLNVGLFYVVGLAGLAFVMHGQPPSDDSYIGMGVEAYSYSDAYDGEELTYKEPSFESRSASAVGVFITCGIGLVIGVVLKSLVLRNEGKWEKRTLESSNRWEE